jgi:DNA-binding response OmpR family regulator
MAPAITVGMKILVVDTHQPSVEFLRAVLQPVGYTVITGSRPEDALTLAISERPGVVFLNVHLRSVDGFTLCRRLKKDPFTQHVPVVLVSDFPSTWDRISAIQAGADGFLTRPWEADGLVNRVRALTRPLHGTETVLLVEAQPDVRSEARALLSLHGYRVLEAARANDALEIADQYAGVIKLLLTEVVLQGMGGRDLAQMMVRRHPLMGVLYSSWATNSQTVRHLMADLGTVVEKPYLPAELLTFVRSTLDGK